MITKTNSPLALDVIAGETYGWYRCGLSQTMPLYDPSHRGQSDKKSVKLVAEESKRIDLCGCCETKKPLFCDLSHGKLGGLWQTK